MYYLNLNRYGGSEQVTGGPPKDKKSVYRNVFLFVQRYAKRAATSMGIYLLTFVPYIGP